MPGRPIDVVHDSRQCDVRGASFLHRRPLLDRRPDERMAEAKRWAVDLDESRVDRRRDRRCRYAGGSHDLRDPVAIVERGDKHEPLCVVGKVICARRERTLETRAERKNVREALAGGAVIADRRRQFGQRQRVPGGLPEDPVLTDGARSGASRETRSHASRSLNGCGTSWSMPAASNGEASPSRSPTTITSGSEPRRRATKASASADGGRATGRHRRRPGSGSGRPRQRAA